jgi:hypothetical protein
LPAFKPSSSQRRRKWLLGCGKARQTPVKAPESATSTTTNDAEMYHNVCEKALWENSIADGEAYFPPTFEADNDFTHFTALPLQLMETTNAFYTAYVGDWIYIELSNAALKN